MRVPRAVIGALVAMLVCSVPMPPASASPGPAVAVDVPLRPLTPSSQVTVSAYSCIATVVCAGDQCAIHTTQRYQLAAPPQAGTAVRVGLPARGIDRPTFLSEVVLRDENGAALPTIPHDSDLHAAWEIPFEPGQRRTVELAYRHPATADAIVTWSWEVGALSAWGVVAAVHGTLVLPGQPTDDALLRVDPHRANVVGGRLWWDYEQTGEFPPHRVVAIAPPLWERLQAARARGAHREVASLLGEVQAATRAAMVPGVDFSAEVIAALLAALEHDPTNTTIRADLAATYRAMADDRPTQRLNYVLLAARELAIAREHAVAAGAPEAQALADTLGLTYLQAAETASTAGDPAAALEYLRLAREVAGPRLAGELAGADEMTLQWAVQLAEGGRVAEALAETEGLLTLMLYDSLLHFAPPLIAARTTVSLHPAARVVRYDLEPYPPAEPRVLERLQELVERLRAAPCGRASLEEADGLLTLTVEAPAWSVDAIEACRRDIHAALAADQELITALVALPWQQGPSAFGRDAAIWRDRLRYAEDVDTGPLHEVWRAGAEHAAWRLVELQSETPEDSRAQAEQLLARAVMREQRQIWEALPAASQWTYRVAFDDASRPTGEWLVGWGQTRRLAVDRSIPHWRDIRTAALIAAGTVLAFVAVGRGWRALRPTR